MDKTATETIERVTPEDLPALSDIVCRCYENFGLIDSYPEGVVEELKLHRGSVESLARLISEETVFLAREGHTACGMISVSGNEITKLYIDPAKQGMGFGELLFMRAEALIRSEGHQSLFLGAASRRAVPFYEKMGMKVSKVRQVEWGPCIGMEVTIMMKEL